PRSDPARSDEAESPRHLQEGRYRVRLRNQVEATLLPKGRRRLFSVRRSVGYYPSDVAPLQRGARFRLVDQVLSASQLGAAYRPTLRWLPLSQLQHPNQTSNRMERGMRKMPRPRKRACREAVSIEHHQPGTAELRSGEQRLHPMPFAGPAAHKPDGRKILRLACRLRCTPGSEQVLEA